jgi:hypothetical protein
MRKLRIDDWCLQQLRRMKVGERLAIRMFETRRSKARKKGICEIYFERVRGCWSFHAKWTISDDRPRPEIFASGLFRMKPGNQVEFESRQDQENERLFRRVARYSDYFVRHHQVLLTEPYLFRDSSVWRSFDPEEDINRKRKNHGLMIVGGSRREEPTGVRAVLGAAEALGVIECVGGSCREQPRGVEAILAAAEALGVIPFAAGETGD